LLGLDFFVSQNFRRETWSKLPTNNKLQTEEPRFRIVALETLPRQIFKKQIIRPSLGVIFGSNFGIVFLKSSKRIRLIFGSFGVHFAKTFKVFSSQS
jgi:hypothetical protein